MRALRFIVVLVVGLALLTWGALVIVQRTTREWFDRDILLRSRLAVAGAREAIVAHWSDDQVSGLKDILLEITRDERIMGAAACSADLRLLAQAGSYPTELSCQSIGPHVRPSTDAPPAEWSAWSSHLPLTGGTVHATAVPIIDGDHARGFVVLVHDMSFVDRREATTRKFLLLGFALLSVAASIVTLLAARISWRGVSKELRRLLRGEKPRTEFMPFLRDVHDLVDRLASEREIDGQGGLWTPQRLKNTLSRHLHGERVVIVANREPYIHDYTPDGALSVTHPASGLVTALEPVMRACSGVWIAHGSGPADREAVDAKDRLRVPPGEGSYVLRRIWLTGEEERGYYYGFSNEGLWPLCHIAHTRPVFREEDWKHYRAVNERFADAVVSEVDTVDPIIFVQDYHFALLPQLVHERLPRSTVLTFWHIPWPSSELFGICPWRDELLMGLLGSSILGFHTQHHCNNFLDTVDRFLESRIDREQNAVVHQKQWTLVRPYPISIEWPSAWAHDAPPAESCRAEVFAELNLPPDALLGVGVDRLDYTKGIEERLLSVEALLDRYPQFRERFTFVELAAPSRTIIPRYQELNARVEQLAARITERFATGTYRPVILLRAHHEPPRVFRFYRAADLCYVSSLHDGMNLVAKEFVAAREDERGVLVLSLFTGAARELTEALIVNPYDLGESSDALARALSMPADEQQDRMRAMRAFVAEFNVYRWAGRMLVDAARVRRHGRLSGRLGKAWLDSPKIPMQ
jgi:trehalose 6-phosphate synthase